MKLAMILDYSLRDQIENMDEYEIQEFAFQYVENDLEPSGDRLAAMRRTAYEKAAAMKQIRRVLAIELRDRLLGVRGAQSARVA